MRGRKGEFRTELADWQKKGFQRVKINGHITEISEAPKLDKKYKHDIDVVVDRLVVRTRTSPRGSPNSLETALKLADGLAIAELADKPLTSPFSPRRGEGRGEGQPRRQRSKLRPSPQPSPQGRTGRGSGVLQNKNETHERIIFSERFACPVSGFTIEEIEPRLFSFNAPAGACPKCDGLGTRAQVRARPRRAGPLAVAGGRRHLAVGQDRLAPRPTTSRRCWR